MLSYQATGIDLGVNAMYSTTKRTLLVTDGELGRARQMQLLHLAAVGGRQGRVYQPHRVAPIVRVGPRNPGDGHYGADVSGLPQVVLEAAQERGLTLGTAESCTGGLIAKLITDVPGAASPWR